MLNFRTYTKALSAGEEIKIDVEGNGYAIIKSAGTITLTFDDNNRLTDQAAGAGGTFPVAYSTVRLQSAIAQTVVIVLGFGVYRDARADVNATINTTIAPSNKVTPIAEVTVPAANNVQLAPANAKRQELRVGIKSSQAGGVYIGDSTVAVGTGAYIEEGGVEFITTNAAIFAISPAGNVVVNVLSLEAV